MNDILFKSKKVVSFRWVFFRWDIEFIIEMFRTEFEERETEKECNILPQYMLSEIVRTIFVCCPFPTNFTTPRQVIFSSISVFMFGKVFITHLPKMNNLV